MYLPGGGGNGLLLLSDLAEGVCEENPPRPLGGGGNDGLGLLSCVTDILLGSEGGLDVGGPPGPFDGRVGGALLGGGRAPLE